MEIKVDLISGGKTGPKCQGPLQLLSPPFLMTSTTEQMWPNGRRGQVLTTKPKQRTCIKLLQNKTKRKNVTIHNEYTHKIPRINRQDRQKITFLGSAYPKEISQQYTPATHRSSALPEGPLGGLPSLSLTTEGSWIHVGGGSPNLLSATDASTIPHSQCLVRQGVARNCNNQSHAVLQA